MTPLPASSGFDSDRPDREGTLRLSPHLRFGEISPRQVWHAARFAAAEHRLHPPISKIPQRTRPARILPPPAVRPARFRHAQFSIELVPDHMLCGKDWPRGDRRAL